MTTCDGAGLGEEGTAPRFPPGPRSQSHLLLAHGTWGLDLYPGVGGLLDATQSLSGGRREGKARPNGRCGQLPSTPPVPARALGRLPGRGARATPGVRCSAAHPVQRGCAAPSGGWGTFFLPRPGLELRGAVRSSHFTVKKTEAQGSCHLSKVKPMAGGMTSVRDAGTGTYLNEIQESGSDLGKQWLQTGQLARGGGGGNARGPAWCGPGFSCEPLKAGCWAPPLG